MFRVSFDSRYPCAGITAWSTNVENTSIEIDLSTNK